MFHFIFVKFFEQTTPVSKLFSLSKWLSAALNQQIKKLNNQSNFLCYRKELINDDASD
jgi:hypothetical protein